MTLGKVLWIDSAPDIALDRLWGRDEIVTDAVEETIDWLDEVDQAKADG